MQRRITTKIEVHVSQQQLLRKQSLLQHWSLVYRICPLRHEKTQHMFSLTSRGGLMELHSPWLSLEMKLSSPLSPTHIRTTKLTSPSFVVSCLAPVRQMYK